MRNARWPALVLPAWISLIIASGATGQAPDWPWLGVIITDITKSDLDGRGGGEGGSYVTGVETPGPASAAGVLRHDIIVAVDGRAAINTRELTCLIQGRRPGDVVLVTIMRGGRQQSMTAKLARWPEFKDFPRPRSGDCGKDRVSAR